MASSVVKKSFDYVVIGGGSAGCVVANRLSKFQNKTVALIEAGPVDSDPKIDTPALLGFLVGQERVLNWCYETEPQKNLNVRHKIGRNENLFIL